MNEWMNKYRHKSVFTAIGSYIAWKWLQVGTDMLISDKH